MYLLNLSLAQFLAVFGPAAAAMVALYLLDRSRRRQVVSTLRFWAAAEQPAVAARRRRIQQPLSLILQLASLALLLLAIAQLRFGTPASAPRDHVLILDTSSWMAARSGDRTLIDTARERARAYVRAVPARDRVMLVRADGLTTPATAFEPDRRKLEEAIAASQPGATALNLDQALAFARRVQAQGGRRAGEIAFVGAGRLAQREPGAVGPPVQNLRVVQIPDAVENCGLRKVGLRRSNTEADVWEIYVSAHNYGTAARDALLSVTYGPPGKAGRVAVGTRRLNLPAGADTEATFEYRTRAAGILEVNLLPHDGFAADDRAVLELPGQPTIPVTVYSSEPDLLRPVLDANSRVRAVYRAPSEYRADDKGLIILDRFIPPRRPAGDAVWIDPPAQGSPVPVRERVSAAPFARWNPDTPIGTGLRMRDFKLEAASVFEARPDDLVIGQVEKGPVMVARPGKPKVVVFGFHPSLSPLKYELATPLLFANVLRWMSPEIFRRSELNAGSVGTVKVELDSDTSAGQVKVTQEDGSGIPFTLRERNLVFHAGSPGTVRVLAGDREYVYSLTLPELWESQWSAPAQARHGVPRAARAAQSGGEAWPWLALAGGAGLLAEWLLFGRFRRSRAAFAPLLLRRRAARQAKGARR